MILLIKRHFVINNLFFFFNWKFLQAFALLCWSINFFNFISFLSYIPYAHNMEYIFVAIFRSLWRRTSKDCYGRHEYRHVTIVYVGLCKSTSCNLSSRVIARVGDTHMNVTLNLHLWLEMRVIITHTSKCKCCFLFNFHFIFYCFLSNRSL